MSTDQRTKVYLFVYGIARALRSVSVLIFLCTMELLKVFLGNVQTKEWMCLPQEVRMVQSASRIAVQQQVIFSWMVYIWVVCILYSGVHILEVNICC